MPGNSPKPRRSVGGWGDWFYWLMNFYWKTFREQLFYILIRGDKEWFTVSKNVDGMYKSFSSAHFGPRTVSTLNCANECVRVILNCNPWTGLFFLYIWHDYQISILFESNFDRDFIRACTISTTWLSSSAAPAQHAIWQRKALMWIRQPVGEANVIKSIIVSQHLRDMMVTFLRSKARNADAFRYRRIWTERSPKTTVGKP